MSKDPYQVLGIAKDAPAEEIRKAYRKLAKGLHPDLNPGDKAAAERFKEVSAAYDLLRDPEKRARYDRGEIDASGAERPQHRGFYREYADGDDARAYYTTSGFEDFGEVSDLFADLFGRSRRGGTFRARGQDARFQLEIDFLDAVNGGSKRITLPDGQTLDVRIPEGVADGQVLRLKGKGMPGLGGGPAGDALVEISLRPHPVFERRGDDILIDLPITIDEAVLGAKVETPTISGRVSLTVPKGASSGQVLRLRGRGVRRAGGGSGDQLVTLKIVLPERIDAELAEFMKGWRARNRYDPREKTRTAA